MSAEPRSGAVAEALQAAADRGGTAIHVDGTSVGWDEVARRALREAKGSGGPPALAWVDTSPSIDDPLAPLVRVLAQLQRRQAVALPHPRWPAALAQATRARLRQCPLPDLDDALTVLFTSGSSGRPKAVVHEVQQHIAAARASHQRVPFGPGDRWLLSLPLCHVGGLQIVFRALTSGAGTELPRPDERATDALVRARPTHVSLVSAQLSALLDGHDGREALRACREILVGGGPVAPALVERATEEGIALRQTYGATELCAQACTSSRGAPTSCGQPLDGVDVRIGPDGVIGVRSPFALRGYLDEEGLRSPLDPDGYWHSGDVGQFGDTTGLVVTGRADHRFISGGENIHPEMVEAALVALPGVQQAVVVDVHDDRFGARPAAFLLAPDLPLTAAGAVPEAILVELSRVLPRFMLPVAAWPLEAPNGLKPQRHELRALARRRRG